MSYRKHKSLFFWPARAYMLLALITLGHTGWNLSQNILATDWPTAQGTVYSAQTAHLGPITYMDITYGYSVKDQQYYNDNICSGFWGELVEAPLKKILRRYPQNALVTVHYAPSSPQNAVLEPGFTRNALFPVLFALLLTLLGLHAMRNTPSGPRVAQQGYNQYNLSRQEAGKKSKLGLFTLCLLGLTVGYALWPQFTPWLEQKGILTSSPEPIPTLAKPKKTKVKDVPPPKNLPISVPVFLSNSFTLMPMRLPSTDSAPDQLTLTLPNGLGGELDTAKMTYKYGVLDLGDNTDNQYYFAIALPDQTAPESKQHQAHLYVDMNQDKILGNDGAPLKNQGAGIFATTISLPAEKLLSWYPTTDKPAADAPETTQESLRPTLEVWLFTNETLWQQNKTKHYTRTQLAGNVNINGKTYQAFVAEGANNDMDFTNDGLYLDINQDGTIAPATEFAAPGKPFMIDGKPYIFVISPTPPAIRPQTNASNNTSLGAATSPEIEQETELQNEPQSTGDSPTIPIPETPANGAQP